MSAASVDMGCDLPGVTCSAGGGSWWLFALGLAVLVWLLWREFRRDR